MKFDKYALYQPHSWHVNEIHMIFFINRVKVLSVFINILSANFRSNLVPCISDCRIRISYTYTVTHNWHLNGRAIYIRLTSDWCYLRIIHCSPIVWNHPSSAPVFLCWNDANFFKQHLAILIFKHMKTMFINNVFFGFRCGVARYCLEKNPQKTDAVPRWFHTIGEQCIISWTSFFIDCIMLTCPQGLEV